MNIGLIERLLLPAIGKDVPMKVTRRTIGGASLIFNLNHLLNIPVCDNPDLSREGLG